MGTEAGLASLRALQKTCTLRYSWARLDLDDPWLQKWNGSRLVYEGRVSGMHETLPTTHALAPDNMDSLQYLITFEGTFESTYHYKISTRGRHSKSILDQY